LNEERRLKGERREERGEERRGEEEKECTEYSVLRTAY
jgi:hypothetical protein